MNGINNQNLNPGTVMPHHEVFDEILDRLGPIPFEERIGLKTDEKLKKQHLVIETVDEIVQKAREYNCSLGVKHGRIYVFNGAFWKPLSKNTTERFLGESAEKLGVDKYDAKYHKFKNDLFRQLASSAQLFTPVLKADEVVINLQNGTFIITPQGNRLKDFEAEDFLTYQLPFTYNNESECPQFQRFLDQVLPDHEQQNILAEYIGYVFIKPKSLKLEKCMVLYGKGANGKSVFFDIINALLGPENVCSFSLQSLTNESGYQRATLGSKLLNYASELSAHMDSSYFKQLVSGEAIEARLPYGNPYMLEDYAKFIFNANELPRDVEQNEAFFRRFIIIKFDVTIPETDRDPELAQTIIRNELPGIFNWVLAGLSRLRANRRFTVSEAVENVVQEYKMSSDSVNVFLQDHHFEKSNTNEILLHSFYKEYNSYTDESGSKPTSKKVFSDRLRNLGFNLTRRNKGFVVHAKKSSPIITPPTPITLHPPSEVGEPSVA